MEAATKRVHSDFEIALERKIQEHISTILFAVNELGFTKEEAITSAQANTCLGPMIWARIIEQVDAKC